MGGTFRHPGEAPLSARVRARLRRRSDRGASAVEYGLLVAAIAATIVTVIFAFGHFVEGAFQHTCEAIKTSPVGGSGDCLGTTTGGGTGGDATGGDATGGDQQPAVP